MVDIHRLVVSLTEPVGLAERLWNARGTADSEMLLLEAAGHVQGLLAVLNGENTSSLQGPSEDAVPSFPVAADQHAQTLRELSQCRAENEKLKTVNAGMAAMLQDAERQELRLREEAERDEEEIERLKGALVKAERATMAVAAPSSHSMVSAPALSSAVDVTDVQRFLLQDAEEARGHALSAVAQLRDSVGEMLAQHDHGGTASGHVGRMAATTDTARWMGAVGDLEREIIRDKDLEREAALMAQAARAKIEQEAAVLAARQAGFMEATAEHAGMAAARKQVAAAVQLQRMQRSRMGRKTVQRALHACTLAVRTAREQLAECRASHQAAKRRAVAELAAMASALEVAECSGGAAAAAAASAATASRAAERLVDEMAAMHAVELSVLRRTASESELAISTEISKGQAAVAAVREEATEARAMQRAAENSAATGLAEARQARKAAEKVAEGLRRRQTESERLLAAAQTEALAEANRLSGAADKASRQAARAQAQLVQTQQQVEALTAQLTDAQYDHRATARAADEARADL